MSRMLIGTDPEKGTAPLIQGILSRFSIKQLFTLLAVSAAFAIFVISMVYHQTDRLNTSEKERSARTSQLNSYDEISLHKSITLFSQRHQRIIAASSSQEVSTFYTREAIEHELRIKVRKLETFLQQSGISLDNLLAFRRNYQRFLETDTQLMEDRFALLLETEQLSEEIQNLEAESTLFNGKVLLILSLISQTALPTATKSELSVLGHRLQQQQLSLMDLVHQMVRSNIRIEIINLIDNNLIPLSSQVHEIIQRMETLIGDTQLDSIHLSELDDDYSRLSQLAYDSNRSLYSQRMKILTLQDSFTQTLQASSARMQQLMSDLDLIFADIGKLHRIQSEQIGQPTLPAHSTLLNISFFTTFLLSLLMLLTLPLILRRINQPLAATVAAFSALSKGELQHRIDLGKMAQGEFSQVAMNFNRFAQRNQNTINKLAQNASSLEESRAFLQAILNGVPDGIITFDLEGQIISCNPGASAIFGSSGYSLVKHNISELISAEDRNQWFELMQQNVVTGVLLEGHEISGRRLDGSEFPLRFSLSAIRLRESQHFTAVFSDISESKRTESELRKNEMLFRTVYEYSPVMIAGFEPGGECILWNNELEKTLGYSHSEVLSGLNVLDKMYPHNADKQKAIQQIKQRDGIFRESHPRASDGTIKTILWASFRLPEGTLISTGYDITERTEIEQKLRQTSVELDTILENVLIGVCYIRERRFVYANTRFQQMFGREDEDISGTPTESIFSSHQVFESMDEIATQSFRELKMFTQELQMKRKDGSLFWCELSCKLISEKNPERGSIWLFEDISKRRASDQELVRLANYDTLTGLPNRTLFQDRIQHALSHARRDKGKLGLLFLDLDNFKQINDSLGHSTGDKLLTEVSERLKFCIREHDTVARLGGDEFTVILEQISTPDNIDLVATKILKTLDRPYQIDNRELNVQASIGISIYPDDGDNSEVLLSNADAAMYHAKAKGRNNYQYFSSEMNHLAAERLEMENSLRAAILNEEFVLYYQPQIDLSSGHITEVEALIRWNHPDRGMIPPARFIPVLEDTGMILAVGEWVMEQACKDARDWLDQGLPAVNIAVNLSGHQFKGEQLTHSVARALERYDLDPKTLNLEITETVLMEDSSVAINTLLELEKMGTRLSIDDFGTGYSSLAYLKRFPIDTLKIDRSFVCDISTDRDDEAIIEAIVAMARRLKLEIVAEGVETVEQASFLSKNGCDRAQGFLYSKPVPAAEIEVLLRKGSMSVPVTESSHNLVQLSGNPSRLPDNKAF